MPELSPTSRTRATWVLIAARAGYAYNWFDIGPALPRIGAAFGVGPLDWGILIAVFLVGAGAFQVPAGFLARRYGARTLSIAGIAVLAGAALGSAAAPSFAWLVAARLIAGVGAALFFSPAIGLVASLFPPGRRGVPVGGFSSAFSAGAAAGVFATALLVPLVDWRAALALGGAGLGVLTLLAVLAIPRFAGAPPSRPVRDPGRIPSALRFRGVWAVGFAFVGFEGATFATGQFIVPFGEVVRGWSAAIAGAVGMMFVLPSIVGGPIGGSVAERRPNHRTQLVVVTLGGAAALALVPFAGLAAALALGSVFSFAYGFVYAVMYVIPHFWARVPTGEIPLAIGLFNAIQLAGGALVSFGFGWLVAAGSYPIAWEGVAAIQAATLIALVALPPTAVFGRRGEVVSDPREAPSP
jgi:MFS transporter, ACDE family, multidrug resistance protein